MPDASSWRTNRQLRETEDWKQQARAALKLTPSLSHPDSCLSMMTGFENPRETWNPLMGSRPGCSDSLPESLLPSRAATPTLAVRRLDRGSGHVGLGYAVCPVGTAWVGKRFWRSELRASSSCPIRCVISPKWAIPPPIWPTREAPSAASSSDATGGGENAMISESIEPSGTSMPSLKYALIARAVCSPVNLRYRTRSSRCAARRFRVSRSRSRKLVGQAFDNASRCGVTSCWQKLLTSSNRRSTKPESTEGHRWTA